MAGKQKTRAKVRAGADQERANARAVLRQEDPEGRGEAPAQGSLSPGRSTDALATGPSDLDGIPSFLEPAPVAELPEDPDEPFGSPEMVSRIPVSFGPFSVSGDYRKLRLPSLKDIGRGPDGKVIPHVRDERTARMVAHWVASGATEHYICHALNMRPGLLKKLYGGELEHAGEMANIEVAAVGFRLATDGEHEGMTKFWLERRAGWNKDEREQGSIFNLNINV